VECVSLSAARSHFNYIWPVFVLSGCKWVVDIIDKVGWGKSSEIYCTDHLEM
jgi:hypothetical protein